MNGISTSQNYYSVVRRSRVSSTAMYFIALSGFWFAASLACAESGIKATGALNLTVTAPQQAGESNPTKKLVWRSLEVAPQPVVPKKVSEVKTDSKPLFERVETVSVQTSEKENSSPTLVRITDNEKASVIPQVKSSEVVVARQTLMPNVSTKVTQIERSPLLSPDPSIAPLGEPVVRKFQPKVQVPAVANVSPVVQDAKSPVIDSLKKEMAVVQNPISDDEVEVTAIIKPHQQSTISSNNDTTGPTIAKQTKELGSRDGDPSNEPILGGTSKEDQKFVSAPSSAATSPSVSPPAVALPQKAGRNRNLANDSARVANNKASNSSGSTATQSSGGFQTLISTFNEMGGYSDADLPKEKFVQKSMLPVPKVSVQFEEPKNQLQTHQIAASQPSNSPSDKKEPLPAPVQEEPSIGPIQQGIGKALEGPPNPDQDELRFGKPPTESDGSLAKTEKPIGVEPEVGSLNFLRQETVLLEPGSWQLDVGLNYTLFESDFTDILPGTILAETRLRQRIVTLPLEVRYGFSERIQLFTYVPFGWVNNELSNFGGDEFQNSGGLGDISTGLSWLARRSSGSGCDADIIASFAVTAPTGQSSVAQALLGSPVNSLGGGFWAASWNVLFVHSYDPIVLFYGFGSRHRFNRDIQGFYVDPGDEYLYQLGVGFAVNEHVTLSSAFLGEYITEPYIDGIRQPGLIREPMRLRFAATINNVCRCNLVEPFAEIGMTDDAPRARVGVTWTY